VPTASGKSSVRIVSIALLAALTALGMAGQAGAAQGSAICVGYSACNSAGHTSHGYNTTNKKSYWGADPGHNCTNYAAYVEEFTYHVPSPGNNLGNASQWGLNAPKHGATVNTKPSVGAVAWWSSTAGLGSDGHVAIVESYTSTSVTVSEDAFGGNFDWRTYTRSGKPSYYPTGFIHFAGGAVSDGVQMILDSAGQVWAKRSIGNGGWTRESPAGEKAISAGDGVQMILDSAGQVWAKRSIGNGGWTRESPAGEKAISVG
jgi:surface antigen